MYFVKKYLISWVFFVKTIKIPLFLSTKYKFKSTFLKKRWNDKYELKRSLRILFYEGYFEN